MSSHEKREYLRLLEQRRQRQARQSLDAFCRTIDVPGAPMSGDEDEARFYPDSIEPAAHHRLINAVLEQVEGRAIRRAMFFMPLLRFR